MKSSSFDLGCYRDCVVSFSVAEGKWSYRKGGESGKED